MDYTNRLEDRTDHNAQLHGWELAEAGKAYRANGGIAVVEGDEIGTVARLVKDVDEIRGILAYWQSIGAVQ